MTHSRAGRLDRPIFDLEGGTAPRAARFSSPEGDTVKHPEDASACPTGPVRNSLKREGRSARSTDGSVAPQPDMITEEGFDD
jgi:hypothetical protein